MERSDASFSQPFEFVLRPVAPVDPRLLADITVTGSDGSVTIASRMAGIAPARTMTAGAMAWNTNAARTFKNVGNIRCACPTETFTGMDGGVTTGVPPGCNNCVSTQRPPFGPGAPPDGAAGPQRRKEQLAEPTITSAPLFVGRKGWATAFDNLYKTRDQLNSPDPIQQAAKFPAGAVVRAAHIVDMLRRQEECEVPPPPPEDEAQEDADEAENEADEAADDAQELEDEKDAQAEKAKDAAEKADVAAQEAANFLDKTVNSEVLQNAINDATVAAAALILGSDVLDSLYNHVLSVASYANSILSIASANSFSTCPSLSCAAPSTLPPGALPPSTPSMTPTPTASSPSTPSKPTSTPSAPSNCLQNGQIAVVGARISEPRPSGTCYVSPEIARLGKSSTASSRKIADCRFSFFSQLVRRIWHCQLRQ